MKCPKCQSAMERVTFETTEVDRCTACGGLWFDLLEDEKLLSKAAEIDTGSAETGARHNAIDASAARCARIRGFCGWWTTASPTSGLKAAPLATDAFSTPASFATWRITRPGIW